MARKNGPIFAAVAIVSHSQKGCHFCIFNLPISDLSICKITMFLHQCCIVFANMLLDDLIATTITVDFSRVEPELLHIKDVQKKCQTESETK